MRLVAEAGAGVARRRARGGEATGGRTTPFWRAARRVSGVRCGASDRSAHEPSVQSTVRRRDTHARLWMIQLGGCVLQACSMALAQCPGQSVRALCSWDITKYLLATAGRAMMFESWAWGPLHSRAAPGLRAAIPALCCGSPGELSRSRRSGTCSRLH